MLLCCVCIHENCTEIKIEMKPNGEFENTNEIQEKKKERNREQRGTNARYQMQT